MTPVDGVGRGFLQQRNLPVGTTLENRVTWRLHRWGILDRCQYRVGKYRLDYAWPAKLNHWRPDVAMKDDGVLDEQLCRVVRMIRSESDTWAHNPRRRRVSPPDDEGPAPPRREPDPDSGTRQATEYRQHRR
jgi:hypothetical protein